MNDMICAHPGRDGHWHVVQSQQEQANDRIQRRVCGGCRLIICSHHPDCEPEGE